LAAVDLNLNVFRFNIGGGENPNCTSGHHMRTDGGDMPGYRAQFPDQQGWGTCNLNNDKRQIAVMDKLASYRSDVITEVFSNSPPWWMTNGLCTAGNVGGSENINPSFIDDFADYLATVSAALKTRNPAWNLKYIEPFNEPLSPWWTKGNNQEGCKITSATQATILWRLWQSQGTYGIGSVGIAASDCNTVGESTTNATYLKTNSPGEYNGISVINTHTYSGTVAEKQALSTYAKNNGNKEVWQSESGPIGWQPSDGKSWWRRHFMMSNRLIEDLRNLQCTVWCDWQFMATDDGWGLLAQSNFNAATPYQTPIYSKTRGFYCRKNITNFLKPGYRIIASSDANTIAGLNPDSTELVIVISNMDSLSKRYDIDLSKFNSLGCFKTYRTSGDYSSSENCTEKFLSTMNEKGVLSGSKLSYSAMGYSVTTFVISLKACASCIAVGNATASFCTGDSIMLTSTPGLSYKWFNGTNQVGTSSTLAAKISGSYTVAIVHSNGCTSTSAPQFITANPLPVITSYYNINAKGWGSGNAIQVCVGDTIDFGPQPNVATGWSWTGPNSFTSTNRELILPNLALSQAGTYIASYKDSYSCSASTSTKLTINALPVPVISSSGTAFCTGGSMSLTTGFFSQYKWFNNTTQVGTTSGYTATTPGNYTVKVTTSNGCVNTSGIRTITENPLPVIQHYVKVNGGVWTAANTATECAGGSIELGPHPVITTGWLWSGPNNYKSSLRDILISPLTSVQFGDYTATYTDANNCQASSIFTLKECIVTGLEKDNSTARGINFSPQLFENYTTVSLSGGETITSLYILNATGSMVYSQKNINLNEIQIGEKLRAGIYSVIIETISNQYSSRFIKIN
jgi:hypothetical protein